MEKVAQMGCRFFDLASEDIFSIIPLMPSGDEVMKDTFKQTKMDVGFMKLFNLCLVQWDFTSDKQSMERLTSMITALEDIWGMGRGERMFLNQHRYILYLYRRRESGVDGFHTRLFLTEEQIRQSKIMIDEWYGNLLRSVKECKSLTSAYSESTLFPRHLNETLEEFLNCRAAEIVPFKKQIGILKGMIYFLHQSLESLQNFTERNNCIQYMNFVCGFSLKAACLAFSYWANEDNIEETANEMNIALFEMMQHEFIPYAPRITDSYFRILHSTKNLQPSLPTLLDKFVESFVAFFFEHMATTIPKDDFLIFRDQMIDHFTFLAYHPHVNADELSSDFMIKTETAFAKAILHYYGFSDSWIGLEAAKMVYIYFHSVQREIYLIEKRAKWTNIVHSHLQLKEMELSMLHS